MGPVNGWLTLVRWTILKLSIIHFARAAQHNRGMIIIQHPSIEYCYA